jgi:hypothetical protein
VKMKASERAMRYPRTIGRVLSETSREAHRSTRKLTLTEAGDRFLQEIGKNLEGLQNAIAAMATDKGEPMGACLSA